MSAAHLVALMSCFTAPVLGLLGVHDSSRPCALHLHLPTAILCMCSRNHPRHAASMNNKAAAWHAGLGTDESKRLHATRERSPQSQCFMASPPPRLAMCSTQGMQPSKFARVPRDTAHLQLTHARTSSVHLLQGSMLDEPPAHWLAPNSVQAHTLAGPA